MSLGIKVMSLRRDPLHEESLGLYVDLGAKRSIAFRILRLGVVSWSEADWGKAVVLWGAAIALRENVNAPLSPNDQREHNQRIKQARSALGEQVFTSAWQEGCSLSWEQAVALALRKSATVG